jgi:hypothetical protein
MYVAYSPSETKSEPLKFYQVFMLDKDLKAGSSENYFRAITLRSRLALAPPITLMECHYSMYG